MIIIHTFIITTAIIAQGIRWTVHIHEISIYGSGTRNLQSIFFNITLNNLCTPFFDHSFLCKWTENITFSMRIIRMNFVRCMTCITILSLKSGPGGGLCVKCGSILKFPNPSEFCRRIFFSWVTEVISCDASWSWRNGVFDTIGSQPDILESRSKNTTHNGGYR